MTRTRGPYNCSGGRTCVGARFGRLVIIERIDGHRRRVRCDCGQEKVLKVGYITSGDTRSCGCLRREVTVARSVTHGMSDSREYKIWQAIHDRCENKNCNCFDRYGGRGIVLCANWAASFESFFADMGPRPAGQSVDRIDNNLGYNCGHCWECVALGRVANCRWATQKEQARNTRSNRVISIDGETMPVAG